MKFGPYELDTIITGDARELAQAIQTVTWTRGNMQSHCPECGEPYDEPQPDDYICGPCGLRLALRAIVTVGKPVFLVDTSRLATVSTVTDDRKAGLPERT